jgi:hypothetical protein
MMFNFVGLIFLLELFLIKEAYRFLEKGLSSISKV